MDDSDDISSAPTPGLSKTPSWIMLGFVLGALFFWALPRSKTTAPVVAPVAATVVTDKPAAKPIPTPRMTAVEAIFSEWGKYAVWENDVTEVALWNPDVNRFADFFEVIRVNGNYYFRSIPRFTHPVLNHGVPKEAPMQFSETEEHRQRFLQDVTEENRRGFSDAVRDAFVGKPRPEIKAGPTPSGESAPSPTGQP
jgi:hypothetical protein